MAIQKYEIFKCDTCNRKISKETDQLRPSISRCNITFKCVGKLEKIGQSDAKVNYSDTVAGLVNWSDRFEQTNDIPVVEPNVFNILSGASDISLAVLEETSIILGDSFSTNLTSKKFTETQFREFLYIRRNNTSEIFGPDDSPSSITLRFTLTNSVKVFINGIEIPDSDYELNSSSGVIQFNSPLIENISNIKVIVFDPSDVVERTLNFVKEYTPSSAWGNIETIEIIGKDQYNAYRLDTYVVYSTENLNDLEINDILEFQDIDDCLLLLSKKPFSNYDRVLDSVIRINDISGTSENPLEIVYQLNNVNEIELVTESTLGFGLVPYIKVQRYNNQLDIITDDVSTSNTQSTNKLIN